MKYYYLKEGDIIMGGDECNDYGKKDENGNPIFVKMKSGAYDNLIIGEKFCKNLYPIRRLVKSFDKFDSKENPNWA